MARKAALCFISALFVLLGFCDIFAQAVYVMPARTIGSKQYLAGQILVKFKANVPASRINEINGRHNATVLAESRVGRFKIIKVPKGQKAPQFADDYSSEPDVEYAELNYLAYAMFNPNDPLLQYQWNFYNSINGGIRANLAWDITTGDPNIVIAVVDTGIAYEANGKRYEQAPELSNVHFVAGYDFVNNDTHPNDDDGHGTHVAGTLAQNTNNGIGPAGLAFNCSIMPIKVLNKRGSGTYADIADGIYFAVDNGAKVINMSLGGSADSTTLRNACQYAYDQGVTLVCAAGNEYQQGNAPSYPAAYDEYCIAVGAVRFDKTRAYYSNTGSYLDIAAPGGDMNVDQNGDGYTDGILQQTFGNNPTDWNYYFYEGTSMATPHVSAVAALLISQGANSPDAVREAIQNTATDMGTPGWDSQYGWGVLDAFGALMYQRRNGDFNGDGKTDLSDLYALTTYWLEDAPTVDIFPPGGDSIINFGDFTSLAANWNN
jgi:serine protease